MRGERGEAGRERAEERVATAGIGHLDRDRTGALGVGAGDVAPEEARDHPDAEAREHAGETRIGGGLREVLEARLDGVLLLGLRLLRIGDVVGAAADDEPRVPVDDVLGEELAHEVDAIEMLRPQAHGAAEGLVLRRRGIRLRTHAHVEELRGGHA